MKAGKNIDKKTAPHTGQQSWYHRFPMWIVYILLVVVAAVPFLINAFAAPQIITLKNFETEMVSRDAVKKITIIDKSRAEIYIRPEFAANPAFQMVFKPAIGKKINPGPHYWLTIESVESFQKELNELQQGKIPSTRIPVEFRSTATSWRDIIVWLVATVLMTAIVYIVITLVHRTGSRRKIYDGKSGTTFIETKQDTIPLL
jgi:AFG3 family protein